MIYHAISRQRFDALHSQFLDAIAFSFVDVAWDFREFRSVSSWHSPKRKSPSSGNLDCIAGRSDINLFPLKNGLSIQNVSHIVCTKYPAEMVIVLWFTGENCRRSYTRNITVSIYRPISIACRGPGSFKKSKTDRSVMPTGTPLLRCNQLSFTR